MMGDETIAGERRRPRAISVGCADGGNGEVPPRQTRGLAVQRIDRSDGLDFVKTTVEHEKDRFLRAPS